MHRLKAHLFHHLRCCDRSNHWQAARQEIQAFGMGVIGEPLGEEQEVELVGGWALLR